MQVIYFCNTSIDDCNNYKCDVLKSKLVSRIEDWDITSVIDPVVYGDKEKFNELVKDVDVMISTMDNFRVTHFLKK